MKWNPLDTAFAFVLFFAAFLRAFLVKSDDDNNVLGIKDVQRLHKKFAIQVKIKEFLQNLQVWSEKDPGSYCRQRESINTLSFFLRVRRALVVVSLIVTAVMVS